MSAFAYYQPGWKGMVGEVKPGQCRTVMAKDVPDRYWEKHPSAYHIGVRDDKFAVWYEYANVNVAEPPVAGGVSRAHGTHNTYGWCYAVLIPEKYFEPEENEFGLISP